MSNDSFLQWVEGKPGRHEQAATGREGARPHPMGAFEPSHRSPDRRQRGVSPLVWAAVAGGAGVVGVGALGFVLLGRPRPDEE